MAIRIRRALPRNAVYHGCSARLLYNRAHGQRLGVSSKRPLRVLRPHRDWLVLDFVVAAIGLIFLALALSGLVAGIGAGTDLAALSTDCSASRCLHTGTLDSKERIHTSVGGYGGLYSVGPSPDYCVLTMKLDIGTEQAAVPGPICDVLSVPSPIKAELWRGRAVAVQTKAGTVATFMDPSNALFSGLLRMIALVPFGLCVAMIEVDVARHRHVWRVRHRLFGWRSTKRSRIRRSNGG
jgi:hypothetical protein